MAHEINIFYVYSHKDEALREELEKHLCILKRQGLTIEWSDRRIGAGMEWSGEIQTHLNTSHIILLLVSPDFMVSDYCYDVEVKRAMERHQTGEACVIPIILRQVYWEGAPFGGLQALPKDAKPVLSSHWHDLDEAFFDVAQGIRRVVEELREKSSVNLPTPKQSHEVPEKILGSNELYNALLTLNYKEQVRLFRRFVEEKHRIGTFLIHGEPEYGQGWLLHRLLRQFPQYLTVKVFPFSFQRMGRGRSLDALWRELGSWAGLTNCGSPQMILEQIHRLWLTQSVILVLRNLNVVDEEYINKLIQDFWLPLVKRAICAPSQSSSYHLLMFFIDNDNCVDKWNIPFARQLDLTWEPHVPIKLEKLTPFPANELYSWIEHELDSLPTKLSVPEILEESDGGIPELVLERICSLCGCDWYERAKVWTKY